MFLAPDQGVTHYSGHRLFRPYQEVRAEYRTWRRFGFPQKVNAEVKCPTDLKECRAWQIARRRMHPILHR
nr:K281 [uncultured bacterium]